MTTAILKQIDGSIGRGFPASILDLVGRVGLSFIFIAAGLNKIQGYQGTLGYMDSAGVPGGLLPLVILLEVGAGLALLFGFQTRIAALSLAAFSVVAALLFHGGEEFVQGLLFMKNITIAGGLMVLAAHGAGRFSLDAKLMTKDTY